MSLGDLQVNDYWDFLKEKIIIIFTILQVNGIMENITSIKGGPRVRLEKN